jgi:hypothetical protein
MSEMTAQPAYDDNARLYCYDNRWNLHYMFPSTEPAATVREAEAMPLSKDALQKVIAELRQHDSLVGRA